MADSQPTLTLAELKVDLPQLESAIQQVTQIASDINEDILIINQAMTNIAGCWQTPAAATFPPVEAACTKQMAGLSSLLEEMISRMKSAYSNYVSMEEANTSNFSG